MKGNNICLHDTIEVITSAYVVWHLPHNKMAITSAKALKSAYIDVYMYIQNTQKGITSASDN